MRVRSSSERITTYVRKKSVYFLWWRLWNSFSIFGRICRSICAYTQLGWESLEMHCHWWTKCQMCTNVNRAEFTVIVFDGDDYTVTDGVDADNYSSNTMGTWICKIDDKVTLSASNRLRHQTAKKTKNNNSNHQVRSVEMIIRFLCIQSRYLFVNRRHLSHINTRDHPYPIGVHTITIIVCRLQLRKSLQCMMRRAKQCFFHLFCTLGAPSCQQLNNTDGGCRRILWTIR